ncbi:MAG: helicase-related protein [Planctomycetota bacterium]
MKRNVLDILGIGKKAVSLYPTDGNAAVSENSQFGTGDATGDAGFADNDAPDIVRRLARGQFGDADRHVTRLTALRLSAYEPLDTLLAVSAAKTVMEPYQIECVRRVMTSYRRRFLIADDVGLGKTIEAGMIFKELDARGLAQRALIVCPAPLTFQWKAEMAERFGAEFTVYDSGEVRRVRKSSDADCSPWELKQRVITSVDFAKRQSVAAQIASADWDLVIIDEAHRMSVNTSGEHIQLTQRYRLAESLSAQTEAMLLLTATPHRGDRQAFIKLMALLDPVRFDDSESVSASQIASMMIRRGKAELKDVKGRPVFRRRKVAVAPVQFTPPEWALYNSVTEYTREGYNLAVRNGSNAGGFAMVLLQRRMASSIHSLRVSLERRAEKLKKLKGDVKTAKRLSSRRVAVAESLPPDKDTDDRFDADTVAQTRDDLDTEILQVEELLRMAKAIPRDSKARALRRFLDGIFSKDPSERVLIFTEFADTLSYLKNDVLRDFRTGCIFGSMQMPDRRAEIERFRAGDSQILICTDAAGEGLNMQFCHIMLNYELPWNPNRIDQRLGRLHRYGQTREVSVHHLQVTGTREALIFERLQQKINQIEDDLGGRISDVLGGLMESIDFEAMIMSALDESESGETDALPSAVEEEIEKRGEMLKQVERDLMMNLEGFDARQARAMTDAMTRGKYAPERVKRFVVNATRLAGGNVRKDRDVNGVYRITPPAGLSFGVNGSRDSFLVAFDPAIDAAFGGGKDSVEFITAGHPYLNALLKRWADDLSAGTAMFESESIQRPQAEFVFRTVYRDGTGSVVEEQLISVAIDADGAVVPALSKSSVEPLVTGSASAFRFSDIRSRLRSLYERALAEAGAWTARRLKEIDAGRGAVLRERLNEAARHYTSVQTRLETKRETFLKSLAAGAGVELHVLRVEKQLRTAAANRLRTEADLRNRLSTRKEMAVLVAATLIAPKR